MIRFSDIISAVKEYDARADFDLLQLGYDFAVEAHKGQLRKNGEEYIQHCLGVARYLTKIKMDETTIIAGLLHDVVDETGSTLLDIQKNFGEDVAFLVEGVGRLGKIKYRGLSRYVENLRRMFVGVTHDIRIIIIKFADRLNNLETLDVLDPIKQLRIAREVLEVYAPIADRLGIGYFKGELEDRAFKYVYPEEYDRVHALVDPKIHEREKYLENIKRMFQKALAQEGITSIDMESRVKRLYSAYRKMLKRGSLSLDGIYDLVAMRIIVKSIADCYAVLGVIHKYWKPLPAQIKDYIAQPKPNNYRSLHTTVFCEKGEIVEFQIRTLDMQREAEFGIAAHWNYDESGKVSRTMTKNLDWLQEFFSGRTTGALTHEEYFQSLKLDVFQNRIFVFTPKGDVINLPENATPVDFAYHIHSDIGRKCAGVRVNDMITSLDTMLKSGDVVEIIIEKNRKKPSADWLKFAKTNIARVRIKAQLRAQK
jgi:GTP pyrophosphokinase